MYRKGNILASSASSDAVVLRPGEIKDANLAADRLSEILEMDRATVYERATAGQYSERWLKRQISEEQAQAIRELASGKEAMAGACLARAARFDSERAYAKYLALYKELCP